MATHVQDVVRQIRYGELILPEFQRGYVWKPEQVREYVRSLYRKHPTGELLVWKSYRSSPGDGAAGPNGYTQLLLDGQQRLTSLYVLFEGKPPPFYDGEDLFLDLYFNLLTEEFRFWQKKFMEGNPAWVSVHGVLRQGIGRFLEQISEKGTPEQQELVHKRLGKLNQLDAIRNYTYSVNYLADDNLELDEVVDIFNKVNHAGTPLTTADLAFARVSVAWPQGRPAMQAFSAEEGKQGFPFKLDFLIRCIAAVASGSVALESNLDRLTGEELQEAWERVRKSLEYLVNVLRFTAYVDDLDDLPAPNALIPIVAYLARAGSTFKDDEDRGKFVRWLLLASIWGRYSGSSETYLQRDLQTLGEADPTARMENDLVKERNRSHLTADDLVGVGPQSRIYKVARILMRAMGATDWFTGKPLYTPAGSWPQPMVVHDVFPKKLLYEGVRDATQRRERQRRANEIANRAFLVTEPPGDLGTAPPEQYLPRIAQEDPGALEAQSIPLNPDLWRLDQFHAFLAERRRLLAANMNRHLDSLLPQADHQLDVAALLAQDESDILEFKSSLRWDVKQQCKNSELERMVTKTVAAFLNTRGGTLLIGVADDGQVLGLDADYKVTGDKGWDGFDLHLNQVLMNDLGAAALTFVNVRSHAVDGVDICQVLVKQASFPVYLGKQQQFYVRTGGATKELGAAEAVKYALVKWGRTS